MGHFPTNMAEAIEWLASFGGGPDGGVTRTLYSQPWKDAQQALKGWIDVVGLAAYYDGIGNLFGRLSSNDPNAPTILVGSHVDTVKSGGKYDGAYGILAAILALGELKQKYGKPSVNLEVVSLCEEEGSRFPLACWGSGMITGAYTFRDIKDVRDSDGVEFMTAMKAAGFGLTDQDYQARDDLQAFIELHIEQGPTLEKLEKQVGIVQTIVGQKRFRITINGETNHAGTTLMKWRKDPLHGSVNMIHDLNEICNEYDEGLVTTVGQLFVTPNVPNVIPGEVEFTVDARHPKESILNDFCERFSSSFLKIAEEMGLGLALNKWLEMEPVPMDGNLNEKVQEICVKNNVSYHVMNSGAGHDAQLFARICPAAILFVPSQAGISHSPFEYTSIGDLETGLQVLTQLLHQLAY